MRDVAIEFDLERHKGSFINHVDKFLDIFYPPSPFRDHFYEIRYVNVIKQSFGTHTPPPSTEHVVYG